jgi:hypothetical protein
MRILIGDIKEHSPTSFQTADLRVSLPPGQAVLQRARVEPAPEEGEPGAEPSLELLLKLSLSEGTTTLILDYELLR